MQNKKSIIKALRNKKMVANMNPKDLAIKVQRYLDNGILNVNDIPQHVRGIVKGIDSTPLPTIEELVAEIKLIKKKQARHTTEINELKDGN